MSAWLLEAHPVQAELAKRFLALAQQGRLVLPGAHDPLAALLAKKAGFSAVYLSGAALSASMGMPDLGLLTLQEVKERAKGIVQSTLLPLVVDVDTGFGEVLNVVRMARELVEVGVAAIQIEDQEMPKKCGHLSGKKLVPPESMVQKIQAIKAIVPTLVIIARTDAQAVEGIEGVIRRALMYVQAGAEIIFPEALVSKDEFMRVREAVPVPLLANLTEFGKTPLLSADEVFEMGYEIALFPVSALRVAARAMEKFYESLYREGSTSTYLPYMQTRAELYQLISYHTYEEFDKEIAANES
ncbi:MAG: methylisocitrate lyase [Bacteroidia bacterium]|nr:methylisocitrate lyase [Bacteroidia bacterium]MDW8134586.1 methylisocitrate lyase [Bacteroidia bacterium]